MLLILSALFFGPPAPFDEGAARAAVVTGQRWSREAWDARGVMIGLVYPGDETATHKRVHLFDGRVVVRPKLKDRGQP